MPGIRRRMLSWDQRAMERRLREGVAEGRYPADGAALQPAPAPVVLRRDVDEPQHPAWFRIMAPVKHEDGLHWHFVTEERQLHRAIALCSQYGFRAVVQNCHGKKEYDNWKQVEAA